MTRVTVIGAGAWGTALALQSLRAGNPTTLVARHPERIGHTNPRLPGIPLPAELRLAAAPDPDPGTLLLAVPTQSLDAVLAALPPGPAPLLLGCKGIAHAGHRLPLELAAHRHPGRPAAILGGPSFAHELARGLPTAAVLASTDATLRVALIDTLATQAFRLYGNDDPVGVQLGGAAKNVIAIACGTVIGAGLGENARAALITRGLAELARLVEAEGGRAATVAGLSGLGDLVLSCAGPSSRNYALGLAIGRGAPPASLLGPDAPLAEGAHTAPALLARAPALDLPICEATHALLAGDLTLADAIARLLARPLRHE